MVVGQKDTGVQGLQQAAVVIPAVHQWGGLDIHRRPCGLYRGRDSPWAAIVAYDELVDWIRFLDLTHLQARGVHECEPAFCHEWIAEIHTVCWRSP